MKPTADVPIRKRTQIAKTNKTMFLWIAVSSALVGSALVVSLFMAQKLVYNEKVLAAKQLTVSNLEHNNTVITELQDAVRVLDTNSALISSKANEDDQAVQVILDALPSEANSFALGASLQNKLLSGINGLSIESMRVDPVLGIETDAGNSKKVAANEITFQFVVKGSQRSLKEALVNLEKSIRTIEVTSVSIEIQSKGPQMTVKGKAYFEPAATLELKSKEVPR